MSLRKNRVLTSSVVVVLFVLSLVSVEDALQLPSKSDVESLKEIQQLVQKVQHLFAKKVEGKIGQEGNIQGTLPEDEENNMAADGEDVASDGEDLGSDAELGDEETGNDVAVVDESGENGKDPNGCSCSTYWCRCCTYVRFPGHYYSSPFCLSLSLRRTWWWHSGVLANLKYGSRTLFSKLVSGRHPKPLCGTISFLWTGASVCIQLNHLSSHGRIVSGCSTFLVLHYSTAWRVNFGCFRFYAVDNKLQDDERELPLLDEPHTSEEGPEQGVRGEVQKKSIEPGSIFLGKFQQKNLKAENLEEK